MKPESILHADLLDIIFQGRNKAYGAYALRKEYDQRMLKALSAAFLLTILCTAGWLTSRYYNTSEAVRPIRVDDIFLSQPSLPEPLKPRIRPAQQVATARSDNFKIVPNDQAEPMPENQNSDNKLIGTANIPGIPVEGPQGPPSEIKIPPGNVVPHEVKDPEPETAGPLMHAEIMPEFPGGIEALRKYLLRHLEPGMLNPDEKIVVMVQFVVAVDGAIENVLIVQSGGRFDGQVLSVVKKMPRWKPGMQNGKFVPVYYTLPVTFVGPDE